MVAESWLEQISSWSAWTSSHYRSPPKHERLSPEDRACGEGSLSQHKSARDNIHNQRIKPPTAQKQKEPVKPKPSGVPVVQNTKKSKEASAKTSSTSKSPMSVDMVRLIISTCKSGKLDKTYENPISHPSALCNHSDWVPEPAVLKKPQ